MSGKRLWSFRQGDRSEYLAVFALSRLAYVYPAPRQEDFGIVDFLCVLAGKVGDRFVPESGFYVQVKSNDHPVVFDADALAWVSFHMDLPLFIMVVDRKRAAFDLYSCAVLWDALFLRPDASAIKLMIGGDCPAPGATLQSEAAYEMRTGPAVISHTVEELEAGGENSETRALLRLWIEMEAENVSRRRLGRIASARWNEWKTNAPPPGSPVETFLYGPHYRAAETFLGTMLTALAHNYKHAGETEKLRALRTFLKTIEEQLGPHGRNFANETE